ncbi:sigma-54-dependent transcriptional regulator [Heliorestis convoluta]|uniref:Stage 0 sporulation protein A homolog n=1 Tax=Heliorestis convoluta TaxID=356322 RepID=A0A5Q2NAM5_9FIRM|nr:sigma-54 dependent transcriptional regulator [Heliorestis convoluta]QGG49310.1 sigma-54-dependent Fis family transcriptional regulator [Heliorestis convoluta]
MSATLLIIAEDEHMRWVYFRALSSVGYEVRAVESDGEGHRLISETVPQLVLLDLDALNWNGMLILQKLQQEHPQLPVVVVNHQTGLEKTLQALKLGACDYVHKPFDLQELRVTVEKALKMESLQEEVRFLRQQVGRGYGEFELIGQSQAIKSIQQLVDQVANSTATVLLQGERGTGKETVARALHYQSQRREKPLIIFDCSAVPEKLVDRELFGQEDFEQRHKGALMMAQGGTLYLKEITALSLPMQASLFEVLNRRFFRPFQGEKEQVVDVRFITSTTRNISQLVKQGLFREDLYYHIRIVPVLLPPLRQRMEDISSLAHHFLKRYDSTGRIHGFTASAMAALESYQWMGNVKELATVVERSILLCQQEWIDRDDLYLPEVAECSYDSSYEQVRKDRDFIERTIEKVRAEMDDKNEQRQKSIERPGKQRENVERQNHERQSNERKGYERLDRKRSRKENILNNIERIQEEKVKALCAISEEEQAPLPKKKDKVIQGAGFTLVLQDDESIFIEEIEKRLIQYALERYQGDQNQASRALGMTRASLASRMQKYQINQGSRRRW